MVGAEAVITALVKLKIIFVSKRTEQVELNPLAQQEGLKSQSVSRFALWLLTLLSKVTLVSVSLSFGLINSYHHLIYLALHSLDFVGLELTNSVPNCQDPYVRNKNVPVKKKL